MKTVVKKVVLVQNVCITIINPKRGIVTLSEGGCTYSMLIKGKKAVKQITTAINNPANEDSVYEAKIELAKKVLCFNDLFFDELELL